MKSCGSCMYGRLLDKKSCQPSFGVNPQDKPFGMVDLQKFATIELRTSKDEFRYELR